MTTWIVVDASIFIADMLPGEPLYSQAKYLLDRWQQVGQELATPTLFRYEVVAVLRKAVHQKRITPQHGDILLTDIITYAIHYFVDDNLLQRAYELATHYNRPTAYDSQYLALAERLQCQFWTADERFYNSVKAGFSEINWLGNLVIPPSP